MTISIDEADPCSAAASLRQAYVRLVAGEGAMEVRFRAPRVAGSLSRTP